MKQAGNAIVLVILIVAIALVAAPLVPGGGSRSASAEGSDDVRRIGAGLARSSDGTGEWAMLVVGSALVVVGSAFRRPRSTGPLPARPDRAPFGAAMRLQRRRPLRVRQGSRPGRRPTPTANAVRRLDRGGDSVPLVRGPEP